MERPHRPNRPTQAHIHRARRLLLAAMLLAWATQLLVTQWARGRELEAPRGEASVIVHMRPSAQVTGASITLEDVCFLEWKGPPPSTGTAGSIQRIIVASPRTAEATIVVELEQVVQALAQASIRPEQIQVTGPIRCEVRFARSADAGVIKSQDALLREWARQSAQANVSQAAPAPEAIPNDAPVGESRPDFIGAHGTLGELVRRDLARQLGLSLESVHLKFAREDAQIIQRTDIAADKVQPLRISDLGQVAWTVEIAGRPRAVLAEASATVTRALALRPIRAGQLIRATELDGQQVRIHRLAERGVTPAEAAGQEAAREVPAGELLSKQSLVPRVLVRRGQLVTVESMRSGIQTRVLAQALEDGVMGQLVKARSESSGEILHITMIAPQAGRLTDAAAADVTASSEGDAVPAK